MFEFGYLEPTGATAGGEVAGGGALVTDPLDIVLGAYAQGRMTMLVDQEHGVAALTAAAATFDAPTLEFMLRETGAWMTVVLTPERCSELGLEPIGVSHPSARLLQSVDAAVGIGNGTSAADRALTVRVLADPERGSADLVEGGHVQPMDCHPQGLLGRSGLPEAAVDLARLAGLPPASVVCAIQLPDGSRPSTHDLAFFAIRRRFPTTSIASIHAQMLRQETLVERDETVQMPTPDARFELTAYRAVADDRVHLAFVLGDARSVEPTLVHVHAQCIGDVFRSTLCDCRSRLDRALAEISAAGNGIVLHLGRSDGLRGLDGTARHADLSRYEQAVAAQMLDDLGVRSIGENVTEPVLSE